MSAAGAPTFCGAGVAFGDQVVTGPVGALAGETEPVYGDVYEIRLDRPEGLWIDAELRRDSWRLIHHDHVTPGSEFTQNLQAFWLRVIEAQTPLISVHAQEPERFSVEEWWSPGARVIAGPRTLDLEDLGAHVGEQHRRKWTCDRGSQIEDADPREKIEALTGLDLREASEGQACISTTRQHGNSVPHRTHQRPATSAALTARALSLLRLQEGKLRASMHFGAFKNLGR